MDEESEGSGSGSTGRREPMDPPEENYPLRNFLTDELVHLIASAVNEILKANGRESVSGISQDPVISHKNLSMRHRPAVHAFLRNPSVVSALADPSFFAQREDASEDNIDVLECFIRNP